MASTAGDIIVLSFLNINFAEGLWKSITVISETGNSTVL